MATGRSLADAVKLRGMAFARGRVEIEKLEALGCDPVEGMARLATPTRTTQRSCGAACVPSFPST
ncbi:MAG: hypothetical protein IIA33_07750 [Planctomycetes bacterium]|nr:hypothetical protein [Planctomycetota bacterium]